jgi:xanthine dehydrogenase large subunit
MPRCRSAPGWPVAARHFGVEATTVRFADGLVLAGEQSLPFVELVMKAYLRGCSCGRTASIHAQGALGCQAHARPSLLLLRYAAAVSEVVIDTLTGEWKLLQADLLYDAGESLNPALDIGQVEGGFIQGMGWLTTEELWWNKDGKLMTHAPSTYKIPAISDCPEAFRTELYANSNVSDTIHRSKAVGEPPLLLPFSVFLAIRDAVSAVGGHRVNPPCAHRPPARPSSTRSMPCARLRSPGNARRRTS